MSDRHARHARRDGHDGNAGQGAAAGFFRGLLDIVVIWCGAVAAGAPLPAAEPRPNVVLFLADDLGWGELG